MVPARPASSEGCVPSAMLRGWAGTGGGRSWGARCSRELPASWAGLCQRPEQAWHLALSSRLWDWTVGLVRPPEEKRGRCHGLGLRPEGTQSSSQPCPVASGPNPQPLGFSKATARLSLTGPLSATPVHALPPLLGRKAAGGDGLCGSRHHQGQTASADHRAGQECGDSGVRVSPLQGLQLEGRRGPGR